jgi:4-hydroxy-4-methyl-2-oxoglutarate aldolase
MTRTSTYAAASTTARDEWIKSKMDLRKYKSSELYGRPSDPALQKELEEFIKSRQHKK